MLIHSYLFVSYKAKNSTNMAVMEVELPSGYVADVDALSSTTRTKAVKRVETTNGDTNVVIYIDKV
jgi:CD109 antigen